MPPALTGDGDFTAALTGLTPDTTYHFRAVAEGDGTDEGNDRSFTTDPSSPPVVSTGEAGDITNTGATLTGNLTDMGGAGSVTVSFEYGETTSYGSTTTPQVMTETGTFNVSVTGLTPGTTYHFRAVAEGDGTDYGGDESFTTTASTSPPVVSTGSASDITGTGATLVGTLTDTGSDDAVTVSFQYGTTTGYGEEVIGSPSTRSSAGTFTAELTGLTPGYYLSLQSQGSREWN